LRRAILLLVFLAAAAPLSAGALDLGAELRTVAEGIADPYGVVPGATGEGWGAAGLSARLMASERAEPFALEVHLLLEAAAAGAGAPPLAEPDSSPFRAWDLTTGGVRDDGRVLSLAEVDRCALSWEGTGTRVTAGRFAVTWGQGWFFNPFDLFGAFALTAVDRSWKAGIDGAAATVSLGEFAEAAAVAAMTDEEDHPGSGAVRMIFPAGRWSLTVLAGKVLDEQAAGVGASADLAGSKVYGEALHTRPGDEEDFLQAVLGWERQTGPNTHLLVEGYFNGWGSAHPDDYPALLLSSRFLAGRAPALGRAEAAVEATGQLAPLLVAGAGAVANLSDGSVLVHLLGDYSLSDFASIKGGVFAGLGERPRAGLPRSEYGSYPVRAYLEATLNL
jgi:hypothetical protein